MFRTGFFEIAMALAPSPPESVVEKRIEVVAQAGLRGATQVFGAAHVAQRGGLRFQEPLKRLAVPCAAHGNAPDEQQAGASLGRRGARGECDFITRGARQTHGDAAVTPAGKRERSDGPADGVLDT